MDANGLLWVGQVPLALGLLAVAYGHAVAFDQSRTRRGMAWLTAVGRTQMRAIGSLEFLGAAGMILPGLAGILTWLTPTAATCVVVLMILAVIFHVRRPGEGLNIANNLFFGGLAALVALGRVVVAPF
jgi:hypothetical protein